MLNFMRKSSVNVVACPHKRILKQHLYPRTMKDGLTEDCAGAREHAIRSIFKKYNVKQD